MKSLDSTDRFGYAWNKFNLIVPDYEDQFLRCITPLNPNFFKNKIFLDVGCGTGRNSYWPLKYGAKKVYALDFDKNTIKVAKKNLSKFKNVTIEYKSVYDLNFKNKFDIVSSIGVIHHLEKPDLALQKMAQAVKKGGLVHIWVYGYEGYEWVKNYITPLRTVTSKLPLPVTNILAYFFAIPLFLYLKLIPPKKPYFKQLATFQFWHLRSIVLDHLIPKVANYWTKAEAYTLLKNAKLSKIKINHVNQNSWSVIGIKP